MAESRMAALDFGTAIAFVAPGFLAFKALAYYSATAQGWLAAAVDKDQAVGVFLFVILGSTALGIGVSGMRAMFIDNLLHWKRLKGWSVERPRIAWEKLDDAKRGALNTLIQGFYRYYQFYSNSLIALLALVAARLVARARPPWTVWHYLGILIVAGTLLWSAHDSYRKYCTAVNRLFSEPPPLEGT